MASFYEYVNTNFIRLTDTEWKNEYLKSAVRPSFVDLYLADILGQSRGEGLTLVTSIKDDLNSKTIPLAKLLVNNYPNPFNPSTIITYSIPNCLSNNQVKLIIYDIKGAIVKVLIDDVLPSGNYLTRWNGEDKKGNNVASGIYLYNLRVGDQNVSGKMTLLK